VKTVQRTCAHCCKVFDALHKKRYTAKYCSRVCSIASRRKPLAECPVCGKPVKAHGNVTCSCACANKHFRSGADSPNWRGGETGTVKNGINTKEYRRIAFKAHGKHCAICGYDRVIDVHHLDGDRTNNSPENLIPLCRNHHAELHTNEFGDEIRELIKKLSAGSSNGRVHV
jgi:hypothetical protein